MLKSKKITKSILPKHTKFERQYQILHSLKYIVGAMHFLIFKRVYDVKSVWEKIRNAVNSTPTMVFSVIGDSDSFVPRPWPKTVFQTALVEAAKSGGGRFGRLIFFRKFHSINCKQIIEIAPVALSFSYSRQKPGYCLTERNRRSASWYGMPTQSMEIGNSVSIIIKRRNMTSSDM